MAGTVGKGTVHANLAEASVKDLTFSKTVLDIPISLEKHRIRTPGADISAASVHIQNRERAGITKATAKATLAYSIDAKTISIENLSGQIQGLAAFRISGSTALAGSRLFNAHVEASQVNFSNLYDVLQGFIPAEDLKKWSIQGRGRLTADMEGSLADQPVLNGKAE